MKLTVTEAKYLLPPVDRIRVVENPEPYTISPTEWSRERVLKLIENNAEHLKLGGQLARATGFGLVVRAVNFPPYGGTFHVLCDEERMYELMDRKEI